MKSEHFKLHVLFAAVLVSLCVFVFGQVGTFEFVGYDDPIYTGNWPESRIIAEGLTREGLAWIWTATAASLWEPINYLSHMVDVELWGNNPASAGGHHVTNLAIHTFNALLVYWFLYLLAENPWAAFFASALFTLHPLRAESVGWVSERKGILCATFVLSALISYLLYVQRGKRSLLLASVLLTGLAMMTKPTAVVVPALLGLIDIWPLKRCGFESERPGILLALKQQLFEKWPFVLMSALLAAVSIWIQYGVQAEKFIGSRPLWERLLNAPAGLMFYFQRSVWPHRLAIEYPYPSSPYYVYGAFVLVAVVAWWLLARRDKSWPLLFGCLWFVVCWLPVSGLVYVGSSFTTDRYTYLPHIGLFFGVVYQIVSMLGEDRMLKRCAVAVGFALLVVMLPTTRSQTATWRSDLTLFQQTIVASPQVATGYANLAVALERRGKPELAIPLLEKSVALQPSYVGYYNLARLYSRNPKRQVQAKQMYVKTLEINPEYAVAWHNLGLMHLRAGNTRDALRCVSKSCQLLDQPNSLFLNTLAETHLHRKEFDEAQVVCEQALELPIDRQEVRRSLQEKLKQLSGRAGTKR